MAVQLCGTHMALGRRFLVEPARLPPSPEAAASTTSRCHAPKLAAESSCIGWLKGSQPFAVARQVPHVQHHGVGRRVGALLCRSSYGLVNWVRQEGGFVHEGIEPQPSSDGKGLFMAEGCEEGEVVVQLPLHCQLTADAQTTDPNLLALLDRMPQDMQPSKLALLLLAEHFAGSDSRFSRYIASLPKGSVVFPTRPTFWSEAALDAMQYPPLESLAQQHAHRLQQFAAEHLEGLPGSGRDPFGGRRIAAEALGWATAVVASRAFTGGQLAQMMRVRSALPAQGGSLADVANQYTLEQRMAAIRSAEEAAEGDAAAPDVLLPLIDACQLSFDANVVLDAVPGKGYQLMAARALRQGEALLLPFQGALGNDALLFDHGLVVPDNPYDGLNFYVPVPALKSVSSTIRRMANASSPAEEHAAVSQQASITAANEPLEPWQVRGLAAIAAEQEQPQTREAAQQGPPGFQLADGAEVIEASISRELPANPGLMAALRILAADSQAQVAGHGWEALGEWGRPLLPLQQEVNALRALGIVLVELVYEGLFGPEAPMPESEAEMLQQGGERLASDVRLALQFRAEKKKVVLAAMRVIDEQLKQAQAKLDDAALQQRSTGSRV